MSNLNMTIGNTIKNRRIDLKIKQDDLAEQVGVTVQTMSKWERDITEPKASQVYKLSKALKLTEKEICMGESTTQNEMDPIEFGKLVSDMFRHSSDFEFFLNIYDYIQDTDGFLADLYKTTTPAYQGMAEYYYDEGYKNDVIAEGIKDGSVKFEKEEDKEKYLQMISSKPKKPKWMS